MVQVGCPIQHNGIDCGLFAVVICLHIFEGAHTGPHIFTQYKITKLRTLLLSLLVKDRNERYHGILIIFDYLTAPMPSLLPHQGVIPRCSLGCVELPQTIKLVAGGALVGTCCTAISSGPIDTIYIKTQVFRLLRYYSPAPRNIARSDWATQNITHNMTSFIIQPYGLHSF